MRPGSLQAVTGSGEPGSRRATVARCLGRAGVAVTVTRQQAETSFNDPSGEAGKESELSNECPL
jgi:hypothetical protein